MQEMLQQNYKQRRNRQDNSFQYNNNCYTEHGDGLAIHLENKKRECLDSSYHKTLRVKEEGEAKTRSRHIQKALDRTVWRGRSWWITGERAFQWLKGEEHIQSTYLSHTISSKSHFNNYETQQ
jgi:hypothetical protein